MKTALGCVICAVCLLGVSNIYIGWQLFQANQANNRLEYANIQKGGRIELLQDQLTDYSYTCQQAGNYKDGYRDAMIRMRSGSFVDGYEAAQVVYGSGTYEEGYHNATQQLRDQYSIMTTFPPKEEPTPDKSSP